MDISFLIRGLIIGISIAATVGPMCILCINRTLHKGQLYGLVSGLGIATADGVYGAIAGFGLTVITGALGLWTLVITVVTVKRVQGFGVWRAITNMALGWILGGVVLAVLIRTLLFQPFNIPSAAQMPTLLVGDYIFVSK